MGFFFLWLVQLAKVWFKIELFIYLVWFQRECRRTSPIGFDWSAQPDAGQSGGCWRNAEVARTRMRDENQTAVNTVYASFKTVAEVSVRKQLPSLVNNIKQQFSATGEPVK